MYTWCAIAVLRPRLPDDQVTNSQPQPRPNFPFESGKRETSSSLIEVEKNTGRRTTGWGRSEYVRAQGARQVYEMRGGKKKAEFLREEARYRKYGLTGEDVAVFLIKQRGGCVGCNVPFNDEVNFVIDHDHDTGKVRGLLCRECNIVLAHWMTPGKLRRLAKYLEDSK